MEKKETISYKKYEKEVRKWKKKELQKYWGKLGEILFDLQKPKWVGVTKDGVELISAESLANVSLEQETRDNDNVVEGIDWNYAEKIWKAKGVAEIAEKQVKRINSLINTDGEHKKAFEDFVIGLQKNLNPSVTSDQAIEMLSQHIITKPIFDALFEKYSFVNNNIVSISMQKILDIINASSLEEADEKTLEDFYKSVKRRVEGIDNAEGKQKIIVELYDKFFKIAFPKMVERLGIVYTPVEVVDFIIHSVNDVLQKEFSKTLSDENVNILDPFTGTGTFITRLLQSGLISKEDLPRKYKYEIFANEIVLLAYYIAAVNIENTYHDIIGNEKYESFEGIALTDTFQINENDDKLISTSLHENSERVNKQKNTPIQVIIGNPPYSVGQKNFHDDAQNQVYPVLNQRIEKTYAAETTASKKSLYDVYIKAFRWSSDRLDQSGGIIAFVSNGSWIDGQATDGFRKCLEQEFSDIYIFNLRGNQRTSGELSRREGGKIFGSGSRTPIAITLLVKNPSVKTKLNMDSNEYKASIHYHDIGDYLSREEKLKIVNDFKSFLDMPVIELQPNKQSDWISKRNNTFEKYIVFGDKKKNKNVVFNKYTAGVITNRETWVYSFSKNKLIEQVSSMLGFYNKEVEKYKKESKNQTDVKLESLISKDPKKIKWDQGLMDNASKCRKIKFENDSVRIGLYRPFFKQNLYFDKNLNWSRYQLPSILPTKNSKNFLICISGSGGTKDFSCVITDNIPDRQMQFNGQCFPLYYFEEQDKSTPSLFQNSEDKYVRKDGVSDFIIDRVRKQYGANNITKEDIFYYVYGILHSPDYRNTFANDLKKMLPRLPLVEDVRDFWAFSKAGRKLGDLHVNYEEVPPYENVKVSGTQHGKYEVTKMKFLAKDKKDTVIYNDYIKLENIPAKAYEYVVNGKSAIEWILERYQIKTDKASGITNNPNDWGKEHKKPRYILDLLLSVINLSVQTVDIVNGLPKIIFDKK